MPGGDSVSVYSHRAAPCCCTCKCGLFNHNCYSFIFWVYLLFCIARFWLVGYWAADMNYANARDLTEHGNDACDCYFVSQNSHLLAANDIPNDVRFDAAHAMPICTDCSTCDEVYGSANVAFDNDSVCPVQLPDGTMYENKMWFHFGWYNEWRELTGCPEKISIAAMFWWRKDYNVFAKWSWAICGIYTGIVVICMAVILLFWCEKASKIKAHRNNNNDHRIEQENKGFESKQDYVMRLVYLYNILVAEILLYLFYKPIQYYSKELTVGDNGKQIHCQINSMPQHQEDALSFCAFFGFVALTMQVLYSFFYALKGLRKCIRVGWCICCNINWRCFCRCDKAQKIWKCFGITCSKHGNFGPKQSMDDKQAELIHKHGTANPWIVCCPHRKCSKFIKCRNLFAFIMLVFVVMAVVAFIWIFKGIADPDIDSKYQTRIKWTLALLTLAFVDNPWLWREVIQAISGCVERARERAANRAVNICAENSECISSDRRY